MKPRWYDAALVGLLAVLLMGAAVSKLRSTIFVGTFSPDSICLDSANQDTCLVRDAADILAIRRGTNEQILRIYETFTSSSNGGWLQIISQSGNNNFVIQTSAQGAASLRPLTFGAGARQWQIDTDGTWQPLFTHSVIQGRVANPIWAMHVQSVMIGTTRMGVPPADGMPRLHLEGMMHIGVSFSVTPHIVVVANNGIGATANIEILSGLRSRYSVDCNDPDGCTIQFGTTAINSGLQEGAETRVVNISTNVNTLLMQDLASVQHTGAAMTMGTNDNMTLQVVKNRNSNLIWTEVSRTDN